MKRLIIALIAYLSVIACGSNNNNGGHSPGPPIQQDIPRINGWELYQMTGDEIDRKINITNPVTVLEPSTRVKWAIEIYDEGLNAKTITFEMYRQTLPHNPLMMEPIYQLSEMVGEVTTFTNIPLDEFIDLDPDDISSWQYLESDPLIINALQPGAYRLCFHVVDERGKESRDQCMPFQIEEP